MSPRHGGLLLLKIRAEVGAREWQSKADLEGAQHSITSSSRAIGATLRKSLTVKQAVSILGQVPRLDPVVFVQLDIHIRNAVVVNRIWIPTLKPTVARGRPGWIATPTPATPAREASTVM